MWLSAGISFRIGDWFVLYQMSKNLNKRFFYTFLLRLSKESDALKPFKQY